MHILLFSFFLLERYTTNSFGGISKETKLQPLSRSLEQTAEWRDVNQDRQLLTAIPQRLVSNRCAAWQLCSSENGEPMDSMVVLSCAALPSPTTPSSPTVLTPPHCSPAVSLPHHFHTGVSWLVISSLECEISDSDAPRFYPLPLWLMGKLEWRTLLAQRALNRQQYTHAEAPHTRPV